MNSLRARLHRFHSVLNQVLTPGLTNAQYAYFDALERTLSPGCRWLDIGCGHQVVLSWMVNAAERQQRLLSLPRQVVGADLDHGSLVKNQVIRDRLMGNVLRLPFADGSFDVISANMVMEHVTDPPAALAEIQRVLAPGGRFVFHTPNFLNPNTLLAWPVPQGSRRDQYPAAQPSLRASLPPWSMLVSGSMRIA